jgi:hypothetical protein
MAGLKRVTGNCRKPTIVVYDIASTDDEDARPPATHGHQPAEAASVAAALADAAALG